MGAAASTGADDREELYIVYDADLATEDRVADYGTFQTAWLTPGEVHELEEQGKETEKVDLTVNRGAWSFDGSDEEVPEDLRDDDAPVRIVQFEGPIKEAWQDKLSTESDRVFDVIPHHAYLVRMDASLDDDVAAWDEVHFAGAYHPAYKLSPGLPGQGEVDVTILAFPDEPLQPVLSAVEANGGTVTSYETSHPLDGIVKATLPAESLTAIAQLEEVSWIEPAFQEITLDNAEASAITQTGTLDGYKLYDEGLDASTQTVSICDTGVTTDAHAPRTDDYAAEMRHEMFEDATTPLVLWNVLLPDELNQHRKVNYYYGPHDPNETLTTSTPGDFDDTYGHGTHTAGTLAGSAAPYDEHVGEDGLAYNAKLTVCDIHGSSGFYLADDYTEYWDPAREAGANLNSNSWGSGHTHDYTHVARMHDDYTWENEEFLVLRSMGNAGHSSMRVAAVAKSAMAIGATNNGAGMEDIAYFSSRGPTTDERVKPNVVAPGSCLDSAGTGTSNYRCLSGTSMSTPTIAGAAALVMDYYEKGYHPTGEANDEDGFTPTSSLVRATLQISGQEMSGSGAGDAIPNADEGWGRVLLDDALHFDGDDRDLFVEDDRDGLETGDTATFEIEVDGDEAFRAMVAWNDHAAAAGANPAIVNDLDLEVDGPEGVHVGNAFVDGEVPADQGSPDRINVEEAVYIDDPDPGTYEITIRGTDVPEGPQAFALVATHG